MINSKRTLQKLWWF